MPKTLKYENLNFRLMFDCRFLVFVGGCGSRRNLHPEKTVVIKI